MEPITWPKGPFSGADSSVGGGEINDHHPKDGPNTQSQSERGGRPPRPGPHRVNHKRVPPPCLRRPSVLGIIVLSWFQRCGHRTVEPSGKSLERAELDVGTVERNSAGIETIINRILGANSDVGFDKDANLDNGSRNSFEILNNYGWWKEMGVLGFLKEVGRFARVGKMIAKESIKKMLDSVIEQTFLYGDNAEGAFWLSPSALSPYKFYQYFFTVPDSDVVSMEDIEELEAAMKRPGYVPNSVQWRLAEEATEALRTGAETKLDWETIEGIAEDVPSCLMDYDRVLNSYLVDLSESTGLLGSKSAAHHLMKQGGLYLKNKRVENEEKTIKAGLMESSILPMTALVRNGVELVVLEE
ncbi:hypothetical protein QJS10_CPA06g02537 [Acorus calamus]|uniref:Tyrosyl-tRNA synthetase n=1 Tax=Acorus calamus TaxID=4465 RepID=A0AAV9EQV0_ACOCL|nr:hypothetical protein QJS10_CPA06g02537 [Acorus calamus]